MGDLQQRIAFYADADPTDWRGNHLADDEVRRAVERHLGPGEYMNALPQSGQRFMLAFAATLATLATA